MVGVDEVGRGSWAGPLLVVAARAAGELPAGLTDSKLMTPKQRQKMLDLLSISCRFGEGWVEPGEIDSHGLAGAMRLGVARALSKLQVRAEEEIIIDGSVNYAPPTYTRVNCVINADQSIGVVSAASVYAKVARDKYMSRLASQHPGFGFEQHVGYGTVAHRQAISSLGALQGVHRFSYKPVAEFAK